MPTNLRSVVAQIYHRGGTSIGSRRNFSSLPGSMGDRAVETFKFLFSMPRFPAYLLNGYAIFVGWEVYEIKKVNKKIEQEYVPRRKEIEKRINELKDNARRSRSTKV